MPEPREEALAGRTDRRRAVLAICLIVLVFAVSVPLILILLTAKEKQTEVREEQTASVSPHIPTSDPASDPGPASEPPETAAPRLDAEELAAEAVKAQFYGDAKTFESLCCSDARWDQLIWEDLYRMDLAREYRDPDLTGAERLEQIQNQTLTVQVRSVDYFDQRSVFLKEISACIDAGTILGFREVEENCPEEAVTAAVLNLLADRTIQGRTEGFAIAVCEKTVTEKTGKIVTSVCKTAMVRTEAGWRLFADPRELYEPLDNTGNNAAWEPSESDRVDWIAPDPETNPWDVFPSDPNH